MRRKLFNFAAAVSLVMFLVTAVLWVRSYWVSYAFGGSVPALIYSGSASRGRISVSLASQRGSGFAFYHSSSGSPWEIAAYGPLGRLGFFVDDRTGAAGNARIAIVFPAWVPLTLSLVLPVVWGVRRRKAMKGACRACGYDLTGNTSGVCPECATPVAGIAQVVASDKVLFVARLS